MNRGAWQDCALFRAFRRKKAAYLVALVALIIGIVSLLLFFEVAEEVWFREPLTELDLRVFYWLQGFRVPVADRFFLAVTRLGNPQALMLIVGAAGVGLLALRRHVEALVLSAGFAAALFTVIAIKWLVQRPRPTPALHIALENSPAFPSGHASLSVVVYVFIACLAARHIHERKLGLFILGASTILVLAIGFSRLYLGAHWLSDVLAGYALAGVWLSLLLSGVEIYRRFYPAPLIEQDRLRLAQRKIISLALITLLFLGWYAVY